MKKYLFPHMGKRIKQARLDAGLTQEDLADEIGISRNAVTRWENGETVPKVEHIAAVSAILNISADLLLGTDIRRESEKMDIPVEAYEHLTEMINILKDTYGKK